MTKQHNDYVEVYADESGEWRWRKLNAGNHEKLANSGEGFASQRNAVKGAIRANEGVPVFLDTEGGPVEIDPNEYV